MTLKKVPITEFNKKNFEKRLQRIMWKKVGITRNKKDLNYALNEIEKMKDKIKNKGINKDLIEMGNMLIVAKLVTIAALRRKESRGTHFSDDYPIRDDKNWIRRIVLNKNTI